MKAKRGPMGEEGRTRGRIKVQKSWGFGVFYCALRTAGNGGRCETARTEIAGSYSRFHEQYDRPAFGVHG